MEVAPNFKVFSFVLHMFLYPLFSLFGISYASNIELCGGTEEPCYKNSSFWYSFAIGFVSSATGIIVAFMYYCVPWAQLKTKKKKRQNHGVCTNQRGNPLPLVLLDKESQEVLFFFFILLYLPCKIVINSHFLTVYCSVNHGDKMV